jgi:acyl-CoA dehydrogenase
MIDFELSKREKIIQKMTNEAAQKIMRPIARFYDEYEHEHDDIKEKEEIRKQQTEIGLRAMSLAQELPDEGTGTDLTSIITFEEYNWGDAGVSLGASAMGLGNAAIMAVATPEQRERFVGKYTAMAITEPCCGSDTAAIQATAKLDEETNEWILNGEKIFVTGADRCEAVVVWASLDRSQGRPAIKSFVVEKGAPGLTLTKLEDKLGIRASDTGAFVLEDCRIPYDNILGTPEIKVRTGGFKGKEGYTFPYDRPINDLSVVQKALLDMEVNLEVARLLTWRAQAIMNKGLRNSLEASMAKGKAGRSATLVTQKCVELLGPLGYSRDWLVEKWMRDCKITDLFEGTGQIQTLIIARNILDYSRDMLK